MALASIYDRVVQPLEDLPRVKKAKIQFTIEKPDVDADEVRALVSFIVMGTMGSDWADLMLWQDGTESKLNDKSDKKIKMSKVRASLVSSTMRVG